MFHMPLEGMMGRLYKLICIASSIALLRRTETDAYKAVIAMVAIVIFIFTVTTIVNIVVVLSFCNPAACPVLSVNLIAQDYLSYDGIA